MRKEARNSFLRIRKAVGLPR